MKWFMLKSGTTIPGHVFVVKADVTTIKCDAWLCPTDPDFWVEEWVQKALGLKHRHIKGYAWDRRAVEFKRDSAPVVVLGDVGRVPPSRPEEIADLIDELLPVIDDFVEVAVKRRGKSNPDQPPRLALPLIGTGEGGLRGVQGHTLKPLLSKLNDVAREQHVDFVLCTRDELAWSAVQSARETQKWALSKQEQEKAEWLAGEAREARLVLFIGAGASRDVDMLDWRELLEQLSVSHLPDLSQPQQDSLAKLDLRDHATLIEKELGGRPALLSKITELMGGDDRPIGLTHALLASLGTRQAVTTNYDNLFERACAFEGQPLDEALTVLPYGRVRENRPWLLKLHGSLQYRKGDREKDIVLTRSDYMRLRHQRGALYGIVQALLVTKHLLFVGYSLRDEDFHELADEIRTALEPATAEQLPLLGTVLTIEDSAWARLWDDLLDVVPIGNGPKARAARTLQIFLDRVAHLATPQYSYLLNASFSGLLGAEENKIAESLKKVEQIVTASSGPTAAAVQKALESFGASPLATRDKQ